MIEKLNNHEVWMVCPVCGEEYDLRGVEHVCETPAPKGVLPKERD